MLNYRGILRNDVVLKLEEKRLSRLQLVMTPFEHLGETCSIAVETEISSSAVVPRKNMTGFRLMTVDEVAAAAVGDDMNVDVDVGVAALDVGCRDECIVEQE